MVYECNSSCQCKESCQNRVVQKGVCVKLEVFKSRHKVLVSLISPLIGFLSQLHLVGN